MSDSPAAVSDRIDEAIARIEHIPAATDSAAVSFGLDRLNFCKQEDLPARFEQVIGTLARALTSEPGIETTTEGCVVARTAAGYTGDMITVAREGLSDAQVESHLRSLSATLELRSKLVRIMSAAGRVIATVSTSAATPLGVVSVPAAIGQLVAELEGVLPLLERQQ